MKRAATPLLRTVVPAITQVPASFGDVALQAKSAIRQTWDDYNTDHHIISAGSLGSPSSSTTTTTTTTTTTSQYDLAQITDTSFIARRVGDVMENLSLDTTQPAIGALAQVINDTARDQQLIQGIVKHDSFAKFVSMIPENINVISSRGRSSNETDRTYATSGTQTEDLDFLNSLFEDAEQIAPDLGIMPPVTTSTTTASISTTSSSTSPIVSSTSNTSSATSSSASYSNATVSSDPADPTHICRSELAEGHAGVPGNTVTKMDRAMRIILPLTILAVAAAAARIPLRGAVDLLQAGFKFVVTFLAKQPL